MAYTNLNLGSRNDEVKRLQQELINQGYDVGSSGADGIYGAKTQAAVKAYQQANNLTVDGIAGNQTQTSLYSKAAQQAPAQQTPAQTESPVKGVTQEVYTQMTEQYKPSDNVNNAWAAIESLQQQLKGDTKYGEDLDKIVADLMNRPAFQYDVEKDPLFQQMLASQKAAGEKAMEDTVARSAALTGGYGNSWAQSAGQQAYDQQIRAAYDQLPQYYQLAMNAHNMETEDLMRKYSLLSEADQKEFDRLMTEYGLATDAYDRLYQQDRTGFEDRKTTAQQLAGMMSSDYWNNLQQEFAKEQFEYQKEQDRIANHLAAARAYGSSGGSLDAGDGDLDTLMNGYSGGIEKAKENMSEMDFVSYLNDLRVQVGDEAKFGALLSASGLSANYLNAQNEMLRADLKRRIQAYGKNLNLNSGEKQNFKTSILSTYKNAPFYDELVQLFRYYRF